MVFAILGVTVVHSDRDYST